jgi:hypothetical protein
MSVTNLEVNIDEYYTVGFDGVVPHVQMGYVKCFVDELWSSKLFTLILDRWAKSRHIIYTTPHRV